MSGEISDFIQMRHDDMDELVSENESLKKENELLKLKIDKLKSGSAFFEDGWLYECKINELLKKQIVELQNQTTLSR